jgi:hypothetical protein
MLTSTLCYKNSKFCLVSGCTSEDAGADAHFRRGEQLNDSISITHMKLMNQKYFQNFKRSLPNLGQMTMQEFVKGFTDHTYKLPTRTVTVDKSGVMIVSGKVTRLDKEGIFRVIIKNCLRDNAVVKNI